MISTQHAGNGLVIVDANDTPEVVAQNLVTDGQILAASPFAQKYVLGFYDDFLCDAFPGNGNWTSAGVGTGAATAAVVTGVTLKDGAHGVVGLTTGTTATGSSLLRQGTVAFPVGFGALDTEFRFRLTTSLPDGVERWLTRVGLGNHGAPATAITVGAAFLYDPDQSPNWILEVILNGSTVRVVTPEVAVAGRWLRMRIQVSGDGKQASFFMDDRPLGIVPMPAVTLDETVHRWGPYVQITKTLGLTTRSVFLDSCWLQKQVYRV
jgi:hypothetical protein